MRYGQYVNTAILMKDINHYLEDKESILMKKIRKTEAKEFKRDILACLKILFSPNLFADSKIIFVGENMENIFSPVKYQDQGDLIVIISNGEKYEVPAFIISNCMTPIRFSKIMKKLNEKNTFVQMNIEKYVVLENKLTLLF